MPLNVVHYNNNKTALRLRLKALGAFFFIEYVHARFLAPGLTCGCYQLAAKSLLRHIGACSGC